jgi:N-acyl-D-aspartate/D-glutamate deacylase
MCRYTAGFSGGALWADLAQALAENGALTMDRYLARFDRRCAINVACLVPNGNVRQEVMGLQTRPPTPDELQRMRRLVREAMEQGAIGLSSGHPESIADRSTYEKGREPAVGVDYVIVNGELVLDASVRTTARPGRSLRRGR